MFLSRVSLGPSASEHEAFWREVTKPYGAHQALWKLLSRSAEQKRDFLFRPEEGTSRVGFVVLSREPPQDGEGLWTIEPKPFAPFLKVGQRLGFRLRASPVVTRKGARHDVVMDRKAALKLSGSARLDESTLVHQAGLAWLNAQASRAGFKLVEADLDAIGDDGLLEAETQLAVRVDGYQQHRLRSGPKRTEPIRFSTLDFEGRLEVTDPVVFLEKVKAGFGPQKAFGCGLMLLRRG